MARDVEEQFHETWLGEAQPLQGLTFSVPVLCDGGVMMRLSAAGAGEFAALAPAPAPKDEAKDDEEAEGKPRLRSLMALLTGFLGFCRSPRGSAEIRTLGSTAAAA